MNGVGIITSYNKDESFGEDSSLWQLVMNGVGIYVSQDTIYAHIHMIDSLNPWSPLKQSKQGGGKDVTVPLSAS